jgi:hypothetical protein
MEKEHLLFEGSQVIPARPSDQDRIKVTMVRVISNEKLRTL